MSGRKTEMGKKGENKPSVGEGKEQCPLGIRHKRVVFHSQAIQKFPAGCPISYPVDFNAVCVEVVSGVSGVSSRVSLSYIMLLEKENGYSYDSRFSFPSISVTYNSFLCKTKKKC